MLAWVRATPWPSVDLVLLPLGAIHKPSLWGGCRAGLITNILALYRWISWEIPSLRFRPTHSEDTPTTLCMAINLALSIWSFAFRYLPPYCPDPFPFCRFIT